MLTISNKGPCFAGERIGDAIIGKIRTNRKELSFPAAFGVSVGKNRFSGLKERPL